MAAFFWLRRAYAGSTLKPAKCTIDFDQNGEHVLLESVT